MGGDTPGNATTTASCDAGQRATGGGVQVSNPTSAFVRQSYPSSSGTGWTVTVANDGGTAATFTVYAVCTP